jgi:hypothetical protein
MNDRDKSVYTDMVMDSENRSTRLGFTVYKEDISESNAMHSSLDYEEDLD